MSRNVGSLHGCLVAQEKWSTKTNATAIVVFLHAKTIRQQADLALGARNDDECGLLPRIRDDLVSKSQKAFLAISIWEVHQ